MSFKARHLIGGSVRFGRSKVEKESKPYKESIHYLWWEYLRRSSRYKEVCMNKGVYPRYNVVVIFPLIYLL